LPFPFPFVLLFPAAAGPEVDPWVALAPASGASLAFAEPPVAASFPEGASSRAAAFPAAGFPPLVAGGAARRPVEPARKKVLARRVATIHDGTDGLRRYMLDPVRHKT
jgi:hypothetical protein